MLFGLPDYVVNDIRKIFLLDKNIKSVWLYGSRALGTQKPASDIDLCIEAASLELNDLHKLEVKVEALGFPWKVDLSLKRFIDNPALIQHIENVGIDFLNTKNEH